MLSVTRGNGLTLGGEYIELGQHTIAWDEEQAEPVHEEVLDGLSDECRLFGHHGEAPTRESLASEIGDVILEKDLFLEIIGNTLEEDEIDAMKVAAWSAVAHNMMALARKTIKR